MKLKSKYRPELICSRDATRMVLTNANLGFVKGKQCLVATDGKRLLVLPVEGEQLEKENGPVPREALKLAREKRPSRKQDVVSIVLNGKCELENGWTLPRPTQEDMKYPNVEQVIPTPSSMDQKISFNARFLWEIAQALGVEHVILTHNPGGAITVTSPHEEAYAVLMPMRYE